MGQRETPWKVRSDAGGPFRPASLWTLLCGFQITWLTPLWDSCCDHCRRQFLRADTIPGPPVAVFCKSPGAEMILFSETGFSSNSLECFPLCCVLPLSLLNLSLPSFPRSVAGLDKEADLVHMEVRTADGCECYWRQAGPREAAWGSLNSLICILMTWKDGKPYAPLLPYLSLFPRMGQATSSPRGDISLK